MHNLLTMREWFVFVWFVGGVLVLVLAAIIDIRGPRR